MLQSPPLHSRHACPAKCLPAPSSAAGSCEIRQQRGLTQTQLAERIGSTQRVISYYETVADSAPGPIVVQLARALSVTADELLGLKPPKKAPEIIEDPKTKRLWKKFQQVRQLPEKDQRAVIRLINSVVVAQQSTRANGATKRR